ncbi:beta-ketoacyl-ACP synthase III [Campylobacter volucris]|uniref:3-oxoacyl-[acyl-carrier-protein] synthase III C-terminal domain-containing protein n=1 Tax=Campylobacter volucris TaxID=1031542 RepID=UPI00189DB0E5|nr:3-oxoacyl-[acyl-carrier-protein] synthase III C-terminal domain-containing protein [Campylobacter volucris]MBF7046035.1 beta-ketoacyl-ACP synthase III [Campylobacter volucris]
MQCVFNNVKISAITSVVPSNKIDIDDELYTRYQGNVKKLNKIKQSAGIQYRYLVDEQTSVSDLAIYACNILFNECKLDKNTIDGVIVTTQTPDFFMPATACYIHGKLDLPQSTIAFDINQSCAGYLYGLYVAFNMLENQSCKKILFICGNTVNKGLNTNELIGHGVSVSILEYTEFSNKSFFEINNDGKGMPFLFTPFGAYKTPTSNEFEENGWENTPLKDFFMDGLEIFNFATSKEPESFNSLLKFSNFTKEQLDYIFFHQANKSIVDLIIKRLGLDSKKTPSDTMYKYGNLASASIPVAICDTLNTYQNKLNQKTNIALCGFGAGLSWANAIITLDENFWCKETQIFKKELQ